LWFNFEWLDSKKYTIPKISIQFHVILKPSHFKRTIILIDEPKTFF
jgi:hypothetical protein